MDKLLQVKSFSPALLILNFDSNLWKVNNECKFHENWTFTFRESTMKIMKEQMNEQTKNKQPTNQGTNMPNHDTSWRK